MTGFMIGLIAGYLVGIMLYGLWLANKGIRTERSKKECAVSINERLRSKKVLAGNLNWKEAVVPYDEALKIVMDELTV